MQNRDTYRHVVKRKNLIPFRVAVKETDLHIQAATSLEEKAREIILRHRRYIESYIEKHPDFYQTEEPWHINEPAPAIIQDMIKAGRQADVGPMASVAGAIAEHVGKDLMPYTDEIVIENGGDIFLNINGYFTAGIYAGQSPLSLKLGIHLDTKQQPIAVCTSSGTIGHSLSYGNADAVCVVSRSCALADAAATSIGNKIQSSRDIQKGVDFGKQIEGVSGIVIIVKDKIGMWGALEIVPINTN